MAGSSLRSQLAGPIVEMSGRRSRPVSWTLFSRLRFARWIMSRTQWTLQIHRAATPRTKPWRASKTWTDCACSVGTPQAPAPWLVVRQTGCIWKWSRWLGGPICRIQLSKALYLLLSGRCIWQLLARWPISLWSIPGLFLACGGSLVLFYITSEIQATCSSTANHRTVPSSLVSGSRPFLRTTHWLTLTIDCSSSSSCCFSLFLSLFDGF